jgi:carbamate kinase
LELLLDNADAMVDKDSCSRGIASEIRTDRQLLFESNQTTNKGQHFLRQQTKCKEG